MQSNIMQSKIFRKIKGLALSAALFSLAGLSTPALAQKPMPIQWIDLLPASEKAAYLAEQQKLIEIPTLPNLGALNNETDRSWLDRKPIGSHQTVTKHQGQTVELIGYPVPFSPQGRNQNSDGLTFLLVPELGAGLYLPKTPPNQTVRVNLPVELAEKEQAKPAAEKPVRIIGTLRQASGSNENYAYVIEATDWHW